MTAPDSRVIIVGAGVLGLSTALHLARGGYKKVTVFDKCDYATKHYDPAKGCDAASADINKIFRADYIPSQKHYQYLALEARDVWLDWNDQVAKSLPLDLPSSLTPDDKLFDVCGLYHLSDGRMLLPRYHKYLDTMQEIRPNVRDQQFIAGRAEDKERLQKLCPKFEKKYHLFDQDRGGDWNGYLSTTDGVLLADKACTYARHLCVQAGVEFILGDPAGRMQDLLVEETSDGKQAKGIKSFDGKVHQADTVVIACGAWTAEALPEAHQTVEATAGTVLFLDVPEDRQDLRRRFHPDNFPIRRYVFGSGDREFEGSMFPITKDGRLKFGFRARNFTNFQQHPIRPSVRISIPRTKYSDNPIDTVPLHGLNLIKEVIGEAFPELAEIGFKESRLCWYPDSIDSDLVVDYVPDFTNDSVFICSGACGHGFKYLPVLGKYVKNALERTPDQFTKPWKWRKVVDGQSNNGMEEGETGPREMKKLQMAKVEDFKFRQHSNKHQDADAIPLPQTDEEHKLANLATRFQEVVVP